VGSKVNINISSPWGPFRSLLGGWAGEICSRTQAKTSEFYMVSDHKQLESCSRDVTRERMYCFPS
jgi:hypothetical protein